MQRQKLCRIEEGRAGEQGCVWQGWKGGEKEFKKEGGTQEKKDQ